MIRYYVLFDSQSSGMKLNKILKAAGLKSIVVPTPRELSASCGIALLVDEDDVARIEELVAENKIDIKGIYTVEKD